MRALIWDLRGNPGGLLPAATSVLDRFIESGVLVSTRGRSADQNSSYSATPHPKYNVPLVLLVDDDSASASEIVAGAVRDHHRGIIVGRQTYGKWCVQSIYHMPDGSGLRLTTAKFYSPFGHNYTKVGVRPDVSVPLPDLSVDVAENHTAFKNPSALKSGPNGDGPHAQAPERHPVVKSELGSAELAASRRPRYEGRFSSSRGADAASHGAMSNADQKWLEGGRGLPPEWTWSFTADAALVGAELARETGETVVADAAGSVYLLDRRGRILTLSRGLHALSGITWCDAGTSGAVIVGDSTLTMLNRQLRVVGSTELHETILTVAVDPYGHHFAVCLQNAETRILNANRKTIARFTTTRPLSYARFVPTDTALHAAADKGLICRHHLDGTPVWGEPCWSNITATSALRETARPFFLPDSIWAFSDSMGAVIRRERGRGSGTRTALPPRSPSNAWSRRPSKRGFQFGSIPDGEILWAMQTPEEIRCLAGSCDPLGAGTPRI